MNQQALVDSFNAAGQGQVFHFLDQLSTEQQTALLEQAALIDLQEVDDLVRQLVINDQGHGVDVDGLAPAPYTALPEHGGDHTAWEYARCLGETALKAGRVAAFTVAGGQGTRLGFDGPKGTFPTTPVAKKSLFQLFAEKILAASRRYEAPIYWFIMTSHTNHAATVSFFADHQYFGLPEDQVMFFRQGLMPAVNFEGKIMLANKQQIAMSPDGHGGALRALVRSGAIVQMERIGADLISYFQVDNPLVNCVDPAFIGFHLAGESELSSKMVPKAYPEEKMGHFCMQGGKGVVVEYSDMPEELTEKKDANGELLFNAGSIAIHIMNRDFVQRLGSSDATVALPFHRADKKVQTVDAAGNPVVPEAPNGVKFEMFVFDALPFAKNPVVIETARAAEFSPVKNAEGVDSPKTSANDQLRQFARWVQAAGVALEVDETGLPAIEFEISPLFADSEEAFVAKWNALAEKPGIASGTVIE